MSASVPPRTAPAPARPPPAPVTRLQPRALPGDAAALARLDLRRQPAAARAALFLAGEELSLRLGRIAGHYRQGDCTALAHEARRLDPAAQIIGLPDLARSADHVARCATGTDATALAATVARLLRLGGAVLDLIADRRKPGR